MTTDEKYFWLQLEDKIFKFVITRKCYVPQPHELTTTLISAAKAIANTQQIIHKLEMKLKDA